MKKLIFLDLDGPVLDVSRRYYTVHCQILEDLKIQAVSFSCYWEGKRSMLGVEQIQTKLSEGEMLENYRKRWLETIEDPGVLRLDQVQPGAGAILRRLRDEGFELVLATLRQSCEHLAWELEHLDVARFFDGILCSGDTSSAEGWVLKKRLVQRRLSPVSGALLLVGDTESDVLAAKALGICSVATLNGIRNRKILESLGPDFILQDLGELPGVLPWVAV
ncbi:MAG: HAD family hydrolase [Acidobacteria bacterium]|nr:HAD family hydrolase [Acidobacteriota bacterium]